MYTHLEEPRQWHCNHRGTSLLFQLYRWALKVSIMKRDGCFSVSLAQTFPIHLSMSFLSIHAFSWYVTIQSPGIETRWTEHAVFPLKMNIGGSIDPFAVQAKTVVIRIWFCCLYTNSTYLYFLPVYEKGPYERRQEFHPFYLSGCTESHYFALHFLGFVKTGPLYFQDQSVSFEPLRFPWTRLNCSIS